MNIARHFCLHVVIIALVTMSRAEAMIHPPIADDEVKSLIDQISSQTDELSACDALESGERLFAELSVNGHADASALGLACARARLAREQTENVMRITDSILAREGNGMVRSEVFELLGDLHFRKKNLDQMVDCYSSSIIECSAAQEQMPWNIWLAERRLSRIVSFLSRNEFLNEAGGVLASVAVAEPLSEKTRAIALFKLAEHDRRAGRIQKAEDGFHTVLTQFAAETLSFSEYASGTQFADFVLWIRDLRADRRESEAARDVLWRAWREPAMLARPGVAKIREALAEQLVADASWELLYGVEMQYAACLSGDVIDQWRSRFPQIEAVALERFRSSRIQSLLNACEIAMFVGELDAARECLAQVEQSDIRDLAQRSRSTRLRKMVDDPAVLDATLSSDRLRRMYPLNRLAPLP